MPPSQGSEPVLERRRGAPSGEKSGRSGSPLARSHSTRAAKRRAAGVQGSASRPRSRTPSRSAAATRSGGASGQGRSSSAKAPSISRSRATTARSRRDHSQTRSRREPVGVQGAEVALGDRQRQADRRLARIAVEVGGDEERRGGERVVRGRGARPCRRKADSAAPARAGAGRCGRDRRATARRRATSPAPWPPGAERAEPPRLGAEGGEGGRDRRAASPVAERREAEREVGAGAAAQRIARLGERREVGGQRRRALAAAARRACGRGGGAPAAPASARPWAVIRPAASSAPRSARSAARLGEGRRRGRGQEGEAVGRGGAPERELERERRRGRRWRSPAAGRRRAPPSSPRVQRR